jgi:PKD repeat protein
VDKTSGTATGTYVYVESALGAYQNGAQLLSPLVNVTSLTTPSLRFATHAFGTDIGTLALDVWSPATGWVSNVWSQSGQKQASKTAPWDTAVVLLNTFASDTLQFRFRAIRSFGATPAGNTAGDLALDDFKVMQAPACPSPTALAVNTVSFNSAQISFTSVNSSNFRVAYGLGTAAFAALTKTNATASPVNVTGLVSGTRYQVYVKSKCSATDSSAWVGPVYFTTLCAPVPSPFTENFDGTGWVSGTGTYSAGDSLGVCWQRSPARGTGASSPFYWAVRTGQTSTQNPPFFTGPNGGKSGTGRYLYTESSSGTAGQVAFVQTRPISLVGLANPEVRFSYHAHGNSMGPLAVDVWNPKTGWNTPVQIFSGQQQATQNAAWLDTALSLASIPSDTVVIRFRGTRGTANYSDMALDEVKVLNACPKPSAFAVQKTTPSSVRLQWTTGGSSAWLVSYAPGATGLAGQGTRVGVTSKPYTVTGLTPGATYTFWVRDSCGVGSGSVWVGPLVVKVPCAPIVPTATSPYLETFTGTAWNPGTAAQDPGTVDNCWTRAQSTGYFWKTGPGLPNTALTGPDFDKTTGTAAGKFLFAEGTNFGTTATLESPPISTASLTSTEVSFWYHMYGGLINKLEFQVSNGGAYTTVWSQTGQVQTSGVSPWQQAIVTLAAPFAGDTVVFRWVGTRNPGAANTVDISIDDFQVQQTPTCAAPTAFAATAQTTNSVTFSWTSPGTSFEIQYGPVGFTPPAGTTVTAAASPFTVTALTPATNYQFYIRRVCSTTDKSAWVGPINASTVCTALTAPWTEAFTTGFNEGTAPQNSGSSVGGCWTRNPLAGYHWGGGSGATFSGPQTGPTADHTTGSGAYVYVEASGTGTTAELVSPSVFLSSLVNPELTFWKHQFGQNQGAFAVDIFHNNAWVQNVFTQTGNQGNTWQKSTVSLNAYANDTVKVRFRVTKPAAGGGPGGGGGALGDLALDDIGIAAGPTCIAPTALAASAPTTTAITLNWTGTGTSFEVEFGPVGFAPGSGTVQLATGSPYTVTGLSPSTTYHFYVRKVCSSTDKSLWVGPVTGSTACGVASVPYFQNFDNTFTMGALGNPNNFWNAGSTVDPCWSRTPTSAGTTPAFHWGGGQGATPTGTTGPAADHTSGNGRYVYTEASLSTTGATALLETPTFNLAALPLPQLKFWYHMDGVAIRSLRTEIKVGTGAWTYLDSVAGPQGNQWLEKTLPLNAYTGQNVTFRFVARRNLANATPQMADIALDDFSITSAPSCPPPTNVAVTPLTPTTAQVTWTTGGATAWQIEYGPVGFAPGSGTVVTAATNPFILSGLTLGTTYQVYVRDNCGTSGISTPVGPVTFSTFNCTNGCLYQLTLTDSFGDGWRSNQAGTTSHRLEVTVGTVTTNYSFLTGNQAVFSIPACDDDTIRLNFVNGGQWSGECGWVLKSPTGTTLNTRVGANNSPALTSGYKYEGRAACNNPCPPPTASFVSTATGLSVVFNGSASTGTSLTYSWNFGPGATASGPNPTHVFTANGTYPVQLTVTDQCGQTATTTVSITVCAPQTAAFTYVANVLTLNFTANAPNATTYYWDFGNSTTGSGATPSVTYLAGGNYTVTLIAVNACGDSATTSQTIQVCTKPTAAFTFFVVSSNGGGMTVQFDATGSVGASQYQWFWGDGSSSNGANFIQHVYGVPSLSYIVTLIVTNSCGLSDTISIRLNQAGLENGVANKSLVYPNPFVPGDVLLVQSGAGLAASSSVLDVFDALGRKVVEGLRPAPEMEGGWRISTRNWAVGNYRLVIRSTEGSETLGVVCIE